MSTTVEAASGDELVRLILGARERSALIDSPACFAGLKAFAPGEVFENHFHEHYDEFFAVITGEVVVWQGRASHTVLRAGSTLLCPRGSHHRLANERDVPATLLYVKAPYVADDTHWVPWAPGVQE
jgi:quercetin dioxygenase-like cupin family protein